MKVWEGCIMENTSLQKGLEMAWKQYVVEEREKKYPNVLLIGASGAGKSELINCVFGEEVAETSNIEPVTKGYSNFYDGHMFGRRINLIDTEGYELGTYEKYIENVIRALDNEYDGLPISIIWYCLSIANERIEDIDLELITAIKDAATVRGRACVVLTHSDKDDIDLSIEKSMKNVLTENGLKEISVFPVSTVSDMQNGLTELVEWSSDQFVDEDFRKSFVSSQMIDLKTKREMAESIISKTCARVGALKVSEVIRKEEKKQTLAERQMKMVIEIFTVYGVDCLAGLTRKFDKTTSIIELGNGFVNLIVSAIPKAEKFQAFIKVATVTALTKAVGETASKLCYSYIEKHIKGVPVRFESLYSDSSFAEDIITMLDDVTGALGGWLQDRKE